MIPVDTLKNPGQTPEDAESGDGDEQFDRPSKTQRKRESSALQDLGAALVELSAEQLAKIDMTDSLRIAVRDAKRITRHEARRRQMQYIGKLMRSTDPQPIQAALDEIAGVSTAATERMHRLERLRSRLLEDEAAALDEITARYPGTAGADLQQLRQLRRNALKEHEQNKPPRSFREIFRTLKSLEDALDKPSDEDNQTA
jgi:ribosome-associated protein